MKNKITNSRANKSHNPARPELRPNWIHEWVKQQCGVPRPAIPAVLGVARQNPSYFLK